MRRNIYLSKLTLKEAQEKFYKSLLKYKLTQPLKGELISTEDSLRRITAEPIFARISSPYYQAAAMDGVVVRARDTYEASESSPITLKINQDFHFINTGNPIPFGFDAVIKIEDINPLKEFKGDQNKGISNDFTDDSKEENIKEIKIFSAVSPGQHIRNIGEDVVANQLIIPANHEIRPVDIGALLAGGVNQFFVRRKPKVAVIPTGDELIPPEEEISPGKIIEYNSKIIKGLIYEWGGEARVYEIVKDIPQDLKKVLQKAKQQNDIVVVIAGSSAGSKDFTSEIVKSIGEVLVHGVAIMPGKPTILGIIDNIPFIGLPGYPVSAIISAEQFLKTLVFYKLGLIVKKREEIKVRMAHKVVSRLGDEEFLRVKLGNIDGKIMAYPLSRGAGVVTSLVEADALIRIPLLKEGVDFGEEVEAELLEGFNKIKNNIIVTGSHDLVLDILRNELREEFKTTVIFTTHDLSQAYRLADEVISLLDGKTSKQVPENLLRGEIIEKEDGLKWFKTMGNIKFAIVSEKVGPVYISIDPRDIILSYEQFQSSARNSFFGKITKIIEQNHLVKLEIDIGIPLVVIITRESFFKMNLNLGSKVYLTFKASAVKLY